MKLTEQTIKSIQSFINKSDNPKPIIFYDLETTGIDPSVDKIVQIGAIKIEPTGDSVVEFEQLINPGMIVPQDAIDVHGITNEMLVGKPMFNEVANGLLSVFSGCNVAGYNSDAFDNVMLSEECARCGMSWPTSDTEFIDAYKIESKLNPRSLVGVYKRYFDTDISEIAHDATVDVKATINVFSKQLERLDEISTNGEYQISDISRFVGNVKTLDVAGRIGVHENGDAYFTFGKHKGQLLKDNARYVSWMLSSEFPESTKEAIRNYMYKLTR